MENTFEEIRREIHDIRNFLWPLDVKLAGLDHQIAEMRVFLDERFGGVESRLLVYKFKFEEQDVKMAAFSERLERVELALQTPPKAAGQQTLPAREDKTNPEILPPQTPG
jgi:hypothetical protein